MTISQFDKGNLKGLRAEIDAALAVVAKNNGITLTLGHISFQAGEFTAKLNGACEAKGDQDKQNAEMFARASGFDISKPSADGYTVVRYNTRSRAKPWVITKGGKEYVAADGWMRQRFYKEDAGIMATVATDLIAKHG